MSNKNSKIILEDQESSFSLSKSRTKLNITFNRISLFFLSFFIISLILLFIWHIWFKKIKWWNSKKTKPLNNLYRADILDREGNYLSKSVTSIDVGISPSKIIDKERLILNLKLIFPKKDYSEIKKKITKGKFFYIEKKISEENYEKLMKLGDKSIETRESLLRIYPQKNLFSHIIGQIDNDKLGISGLEKSLDYDLKNNNEPIQLTVDKNIQFLIREELIKFNKIFRKKGSAAILMNVNNGAIISLISLPDFDPNKRTKITDVNFINRATKGVYEFGSVFKTFTLAAAFNENIIEPNSKFINLPKSLSCAGFRIREYDDKIPADLTVEQILIRSGNIGSVRIGQKVGEKI